MISMIWLKNQNSEKFNLHMNDIKTHHDIVVRFCDCILGMENLSDELPDALSDLIYKIIEDNKSRLLFDAKSNCDFYGILNDGVSTLISKRAMKQSADSFKDDTLDDNWNDIFFDKLKLLLENNNLKYKLTEILWIKEIIDARYWTVKNVEYVVSYTLNMSASINDTFKNQTIKQYEDLSKLVSSTEGKVEEIREEYTKIENEWTIKKEQLDTTISSTNNLMPNMLTSLGIFVTIIVTIVALYISNVLGPSKIEFAIPQMRYARYILSGQITFNCIFFLLYFIAKLTGKTIHLSRISEKKLSGIEQLNSIRASLFYNPLIWIVNFLFVLSYFVLFDWWMIETYVWPNVEIWIKISNGSVNYSALLFALMSVILITAIPFIFMVCFYNKSKVKLAEAINRQEKQDS